MEINNSDIKNNAFVCPASALKMALKMSNQTDREKFAWAILVYGITEVVLETSSLMANACLEGVTPFIDTSRERYEKSIKGGKNSTHKSKVEKEDVIKLLEDGLTHKDIADKLQISTKTVQRMIKEYQYVDTGLDRTGQISGQDRTGLDIDLNRNINENRNINRNENTNENEIEKSELSFPVISENILENDEKEGVAREILEYINNEPLYVVFNPKVGETIRYEREVVMSDGSKSLVECDEHGKILHDLPF